MRFDAPSIFCDHQNTITRETCQGVSGGSRRKVLTMLPNHEAAGRVQTLVGIPSPVLTIEATAVTSRSEFWTVIGTRSGRLTRALGKPVSYAEADAIVKAWSAPAQRACFRDEVRAIPAAFDPCSVTAAS